MSNNSLKRKNVALIVPCYNEEERLIEEYWTEILNWGIVSLLFVDDGSTDKTIFKLENLLKYPNCRALRISSNVGKANAIRLGMLEVKNFGDFQGIGFIDADTSFDLKDIRSFISIWEKKSGEIDSFDSLWSSRVKLSGRDINRKTSRHYIGRILITLISVGVKNMPYDSQSGFKLFHNTSDFNEVLLPEFKTKWFFDLELYARLMKINRNYKVYEEPLNSWHDVGGSKITHKQYFRILREIILIRRLLKNY